MEAGESKEAGAFISRPEQQPAERSDTITSK